MVAVLRSLGYARDDNFVWEPLSIVSKMIVIPSVAEAGLREIQRLRSWRQ